MKIANSETHDTFWVQQLFTLALLGLSWLFCFEPGERNRKNILL